MTNILLRLLCAYGSMFALSLFISANINDILAGSGYIFLAVAMLLFTALVALSGDYERFLHPRKSSIALVLFLVYFTVKFYFESDDFEETKQVTVGTSGGVVFALIIGFVSSYAIAAIYEARSHRLAGLLAQAAGMLYLVFVLYISLVAFQEHRAGMRNDLFLIEDQEGFYQRVGDLVFMQTMVITSLSTALLTTSSRISLIRFLPSLFLVLSIAAVFGFTSQLVGSNSGLVATTGIVFIYVVNFLVLYMHGRGRPVGDVRIVAMLAGPLLGKLVVGTVVTMGLIALFAYLSLGAFDVDPEGLRISGFGTGELSSVESRATLFEENFLDHFFYSPLFGHTQVDKLTTGAGTYAHSLLAMLPALGMVGFSIFLFVLFYTYVEITAPRQQSSESIFTSRSYALYRLMAWGSVVVMGFYSSYFTWMPLWFAMGLFGEWFYERKRHPGMARALLRAAP